MCLEKCQNMYLKMSKYVSRKMPTSAGTVTDHAAVVQDLQHSDLYHPTRQLAVEAWHQKRLLPLLQANR